MNWKLIYQPKDNSHRLFKNAAGDVSICDNSGDNPDNADDGPLIVRQQSTTTVMLRHSSQTGHICLCYSIPVECTRSGETSGAWISPDTFRALNQHVGMKIVLSQQLDNLLRQLPRDIAEQFFNTGV